MQLSDSARNTASGNEVEHARGKPSCVISPLVWRFDECFTQSGEIDIELGDQCCVEPASVLDLMVPTWVAHDALDNQISGDITVVECPQISQTSAPLELSEQRARVSPSVLIDCRHNEQVLGTRSQR
jgi:hypothetical protein